MNDYEVRDVMNRSTHALIDLEFKLEFERRLVHTTNMMTGDITETFRERFARLSTYVHNHGAIYAQYVVAYLYMPTKLADGYRDEESEDGRAKIRIDNIRSDHVGARSVPTRNVPVLPGDQEELSLTYLTWHYATNEHEDAEIEWEVYADNAPVRRGHVHLSSLRANAKTEDTTEKRNPLGVSI